MERTREDLIKSNVKKYIAFCILYSTALTLLSGAVVQTFLEYLGQTDKTSTYSSVILTVQVISMAFCSLWGDKIRKTIVPIAFSVGVISLIAIPLLTACFGLPSENGAKYVFILALSCISNFGLGIYNVLCYKLPYEIYDISSYGKYTSLCGILSGITGFVCTFLLSFFANKFSYLATVKVFFSLGATMFISAVFLCLSFKSIDTQTEEKKVEIRLLKMREFRLLIVPNFLRGIGTGILGLVTVIGIKSGILDLKTSTVIATLTVLGALCGNYLYLLLNKKWNASKILLVCSVLLAVFIPCMILRHNVYVYFTFFFLSWMLNTTYGISIPVMVYNGIPQDAVGKYSAWRMLIFTFGNAIPGFVLGSLTEKWGTLGVLLVSAVAFLICGISYIVVLNNKKPFQNGEKPL